LSRPVKRNGSGRGGRSKRGLRRHRKSRVSPARGASCADSTLTPTRRAARSLPQHGGDTRNDSVTASSRAAAQSRLFFSPCPPHHCTMAAAAWSTVSRSVCALSVRTSVRTSSVRNLAWTPADRSFSLLSFGSLRTLADVELLRDVARRQRGGGARRSPSLDPFSPYTRRSRSRAVPRTRVHHLCHCGPLVPSHSGGH